MKLDAVTFGESMAMFYANEYGGLHEVSTFSKGLAGAESNVACGLARLGFRMGWMSKVGNDQLGTFILQELKRGSGCVPRDPLAGRKSHRAAAEVKSERRRPASYLL